MKFAVIAAALATAALPVFAQSGSPSPAANQARVEVSEPAGTQSATKQKAAKPGKARKPAKTAHKASKKKTKKKQRPVG